ncbi:uncharacterized protein LOC127264389 [Andrographis paniculata]|uniref:uncharacterized protein LOC127264389 n=1 Tax=Andrographis paniculata TaxID=175694 RepID=UPI0021E9A488|nr:uncharacterized protein LOC127264389 [Andrographis paniculata]
MDRILGFSNVESMRKTILLQEQIFKHQVQELHRIYNLQRKLMEEVEKGRCSISRNEAREVSSSCSGDQTMRMPIQFDLERRNESAPSSSSIRHYHDEINTDVEVELTLGIGHCSRKQRSSNSDQVGELSSSIGTGKGEECGEPGSNIGGSTGFRDSSKQPHWLLQDLSLNRT